MIDYVVRHAHVVIQINYFRQTSVEVLLEVEFSGWQGNKMFSKDAFCKTCLTFSPVRIFMF